MKMTHSQPAIVYHQHRTEHTPRVAAMIVPLLCGTLLSGFTHFITVLLLPLLFDILSIKQYNIKNDQSKVNAFVSFVINNATVRKMTIVHNRVEPTGLFVRLLCAPRFIAIYGYNDGDSGGGDGSIRNATKPLVIWTLFGTSIKAILGNDNPCDLSSEGQADNANDADDDDKCNKTKLLYYTPSNHLWDSQLANGSIYVENHPPRPEQRNIVDAISKLYRTRNSDGTVVYIHGAPGVGKSEIAYFLAKELNAAVMTGFDPTEPGITLDSILLSAQPNKSTPLVILMDEADCYIRKIHNNKVVTHKEMRTCAKDKNGWNTLLDSFKHRRHVILLMTSNSSIEEMHNLDASYMREKRVHGIYSLDITVEADEPTTLRTRKRLHISRLLRKLSRCANAFK